MTFGNLSLSEPQRDLLYDYVDESAYSLDDWELACVAFDRWLDDRGIDARPVDGMLGYLHCTTLATAPTVSTPALAEQLVAMLDEHGFDSAQGASAEPET